MFLPGYTRFYSYISSNLDIYISILSPFNFHLSPFNFQFVHGPLSSHLRAIHETITYPTYTYIYFVYIPWTINFPLSIFTFPLSIFTFHLIVPPFGDERGHVFRPLAVKKHPFARSRMRESQCPRVKHLPRTERETVLDELPVFLRAQPFQDLASAVFLIAE